MPGYKRYTRRKTTYRKKAIKKRIMKYKAKRKAYSYDGIVRHKFVVNFSLNYTREQGTVGEFTPVFIGHHTNQDVLGCATV